MGDEMEQIARKNPCLKARRCKLVTQKKDPKQKENLNQTGKKNNLNDTFGMGDTRGCCSGQTGHHLIQDAWLKSPPANNEDTGKMKAMPRGTGDLCEAYDENATHDILFITVAVHLNCQPSLLISLFNQSLYFSHITPTQNVQNV